MSTSLPLLLALAGLSQQAGAGPGDLQARVDEAVRRGTRYLTQQQELDGSWRYKQADYPAGASSLALYALLHSGLSRKHNAIVRAEAYLREVEDGKTYSLACLLMALGKLDPVAHAERIAALAEELMDHQQGGFAYPHGKLDLSNTQYGTLGLAAAVRAGVRVPSRTWQRLAQTTLALQLDDGGFPYQAAGAAKGTMTLGALTVLALVERHLGSSASPRLTADLARGRASGLAWLAEHFSVTLKPAPGSARTDQARWLHYYLYGLERVGSLWELDEIGGHDWYREGAEHLLATQEESGAWATGSGERVPNTCFALLFLKRATAASTGPGATGRTPVFATDDPEAPLHLRATGDTPLAVWITGFGGELLERACWPGERQRGPRVAEVTWLGDGAVLATLPGRPEKPLGPERFAIQHAFESSGEHALVARVELLLPDGTRERVESPPLTVEVTEVLEGWMLDYPADRGRNLLAATRIDVEASSFQGASWRAEYAVDGWQGRGWLCQAEDPDPTLELSLVRAQRADRVLLSHAREEGREPVKWARARRIELTVNRRPPLEVELDPNPRRKCVIELPRAEKILRLRLRVLEREPGTDAGNPAVGFQEIELRLGDHR